MSSRLFHSAPGYMHPVSTTKPHHPTRTFSFSHSLPRIELNGDRSRNPGMESNQDPVRSGVEQGWQTGWKRDETRISAGSNRDRNGIEPDSNRNRTGIEPDSNRIRTGIGTEDLRFEPGTWQSFSPASFRSLSPKLLTSLLLHRPFSFALC